MTVPEDRGAVADVGGPEAAAKRAQLKRLGGTLGIVAAAGVVAVSVIGGGAPKDKKQAEPKPQVKAQVAYVDPPAPPKVETPTIMQMSAPQPIPVQPPPPPKDEMLEAARRAPLTAFNGGFRAAGSTATPTAAPQAQSNGFVVEASGDNREAGAFAKRFQATQFDVAKAGHIGDRRFVVAQGTSIPCVLETAMQSDQPGFVSCVITRDVLSDNGQVVLMEKGTQVVGEYRGGFNQGQSRLHVMWSRAKTPTGVVVTLASAATDPLGRAGVGGYVDNHWWERFGSALLLSVVGDASAAGGQYLKNKAGVEANGTTGAGNQAAAIAVEQAGQIKPTLHKNQGEMLSIFVARDLDFSGVYKLEVVQDTGAWRAVDQVPVDNHGRPMGWPNSGPRDQGGVK